MPRCWAAGLAEAVAAEETGSGPLPGAVVVGAGVGIVVEEAGLAPATAAPRLLVVVVMPCYCRPGHAQQ
jgi:hypothetical protein